MAGESFIVANRLVSDQPRSAVSRYYYASYQAMSALILYVGLTPPEGREAWGHEQTPILIKEHLRVVIPNTGRRQALAGRLSKLYKLRVVADYISTENVAGSLEQVRKNAAFLLKVTQDILPSLES